MIGVILAEEHKKVIQDDGFNGSGVLTEGTRFEEKRNFWTTREWEIKQKPWITIDLGWEKIVTGFYLRNTFYG